MTPAPTDSTGPRSMHTYAEPPVTFVRGQGSSLYDAAGKEYLDFLSGLAVTSLGHAHPGGGRRGRRHRPGPSAHVSNLFGNAIGPEVARHPRPADRRRDRAGRRTGVLRATRAPRPTSAPSSWPVGGPAAAATSWSAAWDAFHGRTLATLAATGQPEKHAPFLPLPEGFDHVPFDDLDAMDAAL